MWGDVFLCGVGEDVGPGNESGVVAWVSSAYAITRRSSARRERYPRLGARETATGDYARDGCKLDKGAEARLSRNSRALLV